MYRFIYSRLGSRPSPPITVRRFPTLIENNVIHWYIVDSGRVVNKDTYTQPEKIIET